MSLERVLKCLENVSLQWGYREMMWNCVCVCVQVTLMNKDNQSYLVIFDGSLLVSKLLQLVHCICIKECTCVAVQNCKSLFCNCVQNYPYIFSQDVISVSEDNHLQY